MYYCVYMVIDTYIRIMKNSFDFTINLILFYRVKGSLQNSNTFGKAFDCPFINEYSPQVKCEVWWWHRTLTADLALHEGERTIRLLLSNSRNIKRDKKKQTNMGSRVIEQFVHIKNSRGSMTSVSFIPEWIFLAYVTST